MDLHGLLLAADHLVSSWGESLMFTDVCPGVGRVDGVADRNLVGSPLGRLYPTSFGLLEIFKA